MATEKYNDTITITVGEVRLPANLLIPNQALGTVIFAHGSGSNRLSPRNQAVAYRLQDAGFATLLFDLRTTEETQEYRNGQDLEVLTDRLVGVTRWVQEMADLGQLPIGYFGSSSGAALALRAAAKLTDEVKALVSRGGRLDMAATVLAQVLPPTLIIVGDQDKEERESNQRAFDQLGAIKDMHLIDGASHLFAEPEALEQVAELAADWFKRYLGQDKLHYLTTKPDAGATGGATETTK